MPTRSTIRRLLIAPALCAMLAVTAVAATGSPSGAATPSNRAYVRAVYGDLLDRTEGTSDAGGVEFWANRLDTDSRTNVVLSIQRGSAEYYGKVVDIAYQLFLDRSADTAGRDFYIRNWRNHRLTVEEVIVALAGSNEYFQRVGATNAAFVEAVYFDVLGREPSAAERTYANAALATKKRGDLARALSVSDQYRQATVTFQYSSFLGRYPSAGERDFWVGRLKAGLRSEDFDAMLLASSEYYAHNSDATSAVRER